MLFGKLSQIRQMFGAYDDRRNAAGDGRVINGTAAGARKEVWKLRLLSKTGSYEIRREDCKKKSDTNVYDSGSFILLE